MWLSRGSNIGINNKNLCRLFSSEILIKNKHEHDGLLVAGNTGETVYQRLRLWKKIQSLIPQCHLATAITLSPLPYSS